MAGICLSMTGCTPKDFMPLVIDENKPTLFEQSAAAVKKAEEIKSYYALQMEDYASKIQSRPLVKTEFWYEFDGDSLYRLSRFEDGTVQISNYALKTPRQYLDDGTLIQALSSTQVVVDSKGTVRMVMNNPDPCKVQNLIALPDWIQNWNGEVKILESTPDVSAFRIKGLPPQSEMEGQAKGYTDWTCSVDGMPQSLTIKEVFEDFAAVSSLTFDHVNESLLNRKVLDEILQKAKDQTLHPEDSVSTDFWK